MYVSLHQTLTLNPTHFKASSCNCLTAAKVLELYPFLEESGVIDEILPKKEQAALAKL